MTGSPVTETPNRKPIPRPMLSAIAFLAIILVGVLLHAAADVPSRPQFWPFVIALAIGVAIFTFLRPFPYLSHNEGPVESAETAMMWAVVWGVVEAAVFWTLYYLAWATVRYWGTALMMGVLGGMNRYYHGRHLKRRHLPQIIAIVAILVLMIVVKLLKRH